MRHAPLALLFTLLACNSKAETEQTQQQSPIEEVIEDTQTSDTQTGDTQTGDTQQECAGEGEACEIYDEYESNCCNGRHTCFEVGCYYSEPE